MLEAGEDPLYVARRLVRFASEDVGLADSRALEICVAAYQAVSYTHLDMKKSACSTFPEKDKTGTFTGSIPLVMSLYVW